MSAEPIAHSANASGRTESVREHLDAVATRAARYARALDVEEEARLAGLLHDIGKYSGLFQRRLKGLETGVDHSSPGAWIALTHYQNAGLAAALAIQGHHVGLGEASKDAFRNLEPGRQRAHHRSEVKIPSEAPEDLLRRLSVDGLRLPDVSVVCSRYEGINCSEKASAMVDVRMLFSVLVDADFIETEAHFEGHYGEPRCYRPRGLALDPERDLDLLTTHIGRLLEGSHASEQVLRLRSDLLSVCLEAGDLEQGSFTLTAPTGAGKTLSMLAFALRHAARHGLRRIIMVIPYLSIIEQTVRAYRAAFAHRFSELELRSYILEDHSLAGMRFTSRVAESDEATESEERLFAENWDAPIVVTTSVQFLESLFSNRPSACRKLHRLAKSVILFDEVQTLPSRLAIATLATLSALSVRYNASVVFSTATQPAFTHLDKTVRTFAGSGWVPREIVPEHCGLFERARRASVTWPRDGVEIRWETLAEQLAEPACSQVLCILNLKRHAWHLFDLLKERRARGLCHLSTSMCPRHREVVLEEVRARLSRGKPCRLIATQCVEAGVDVDFPVVYRAWGPLDAVAQAAGRCNRNGRLETGHVHVFHPVRDVGERLFPDKAYEQAAAVASLMLRRRSGSCDIYDPTLFEDYYRTLYDVSSVENANPELSEAIRRQDFRVTASLYQVIPQDAINILIPYDHDMWISLAAEVRDTSLSTDWIARARPYTVGLFRPRDDNLVLTWLEPVPLRRGGCAKDWFIYVEPTHYSNETGLVPPSSQAVLIG